MLPMTGLPGEDQEVIEAGISNPRPGCRSDTRGDRTGAGESPPAWSRGRGRRRGYMSPLAVAGAALAALPVIYLVNPEKTHIPLCPLHAVTGLNCPFCGGTRAVYQLMYGRLVPALHDNLLLLLSLPLLVALWISWLRDSGRRQAARGGPAAPYGAAGAGLAALGRAANWRRWAWWGLAGAAVIFGILRNLPGMAALRPI